MGLRAHTRPSVNKKMCLDTRVHASPACVETRDGVSGIEGTESINRVNWPGSIVFKTLTDRNVMTMKGRTMSKVVYVRECPLYSVFLKREH